MSETPLNTPPHNRQAEEALLGALLVDPTAYFRVANRLEAADFFSERHRLVWQALSALHGRQETVDFVTVSAELNAQNRLAEMGGPAFLAALINQTPSALHAEEYAALVQQMAIRRKLVEAANQTATLAYQEQLPVSRAFEQAVHLVQAAGSRLVERRLRAMPTVLGDALDYLEAATNQQNRIQTGYGRVDAFLGGLMPGNLIILAARPGVGKTALMLGMAAKMAAAGKRVALFSLEMSTAEVGMRLLAQATGVNSASLRRGDLTPAEWQQVQTALPDLEALPVHVDDTPNLTPAQLSATCRQLQAELGLDVILVDYLQLMAGGGRFDNRTAEIGHISRQLKVTAKQLGVPLLAAAQLSREVEKRGDKRPLLSDLRESGSIEQDADMVCFLYKIEEPDPALQQQGLQAIEMSIAKHRHGRTGTVLLGYRGSCTRFEALEVATIDLNATPVAPPL